MKTFEQFFPDLMPNVPGCPESVAEHAIRRAVQMFCEKTRAWRVVMDPIEAIADTDEYDLPLDRNTELVRIERAQLDGRDIEVGTEHQAAHRCRDTVSCFDGKTVIVSPVPAAGQLIALTCAIKPGNGATGVEDFLYDEHVSLITLGAGAILKRQPQKAYTDVSAASLDLDAFELKCARVKVKLWRGNSRNAPRVVPIWK
jgi:hypothetical protein